MDANWLYALPILLIFIVPFLFKITPYNNVKIIKKEKEGGGIFAQYSFLVENQGNKFHLPVTKQIFDQLIEGSIVTLYYNSGDEKVTDYEVVTE